MEQIMSRKKFWILRFRDKVDGYDTYAMDTNIGGNRHNWWFSKHVEDAYHFTNRSAVKKALRSPAWEKNGFTRKSLYAIEVVEILETYTRSWDEVQVISNENALIQLARLAETDEHNDDSRN